MKLLYRAPREAGMSVAATSWALFASVTLERLLSFFAAEPDMQWRLWRRVATSEKRMMKWLWVEADRRFENTGAGRGRARSTALTPWVLGVGTVGNVRVDLYLDVLMKETALSGGHGIGCGERVPSEGGREGVREGVREGGREDDREGVREGVREGGCSCMDGFDASDTGVFVIDNYLVLRSIRQRVLEKHTASLYSDVWVCAGREA